MKAITLWRPWATMIALGRKPIEYRTHDRFAWLVGHQIAIHAGQRYDQDGFDYLMESGYEDLRPQLLDAACPRGVIRAVCVVWRARWMTDAESEDLFGLYLKDIKALANPLPAKGKQGVWEWRPPAGRLIETVPVKIQEARDG